jgi:hypothetical protein
MKDEALKLALEALKLAASELYKASSYYNTYEVLGITNDAIIAIQKALAAQPAVLARTYVSTQATMCACCGEHKHTPLRIDKMGGYVCLTCIDKKLGLLLGEFGSPPEQPAVPDAIHHTDLWDIHSCGPTCKRYACVAMREAVEVEREACAKVCEELVPDMSRTANDASVWDVATFDCAIAIRARGNT